MHVGCAPHHQRRHTMAQRRPTSGTMGAAGRMRVTLGAVRKATQGAATNRCNCTYTYITSGDSPPHTTTSIMHTTIYQQLSDMRHPHEMRAMCVPGPWHPVDGLPQWSSPWTAENDPPSGFGKRCMGAMARCSGAGQMLLHAHAITMLTAVRQDFCLHASPFDPKMIACL